MTYTSAIFLFAVLRALIAGYGGGYFFPVVLGEAVDAALPFLCVAIGHKALSRPSDSAADPVGRIMHIALWVMLFVRFGTPWLESLAPSTGLISGSSGLSVTLIAVGLLAGTVSEWLTRNPGTLRSALTVGLAGWLILGPDLYLTGDHVLLRPRLAHAATVAGGFLVVFVATALVGRLIGPMWLARGMAAFAVVALAYSGLSRGNVINEPVPDEAPSVLLVVVDTLRADMVDAVDDRGEPLMPRLKALADRGVRFTQAIAPSPWTLPSTATIMTGLNPYSHRVGIPAGALALPSPEPPTFPATRLRARGYQIAGFVNNPYLRPYYGFGHDHLKFRRYVGDAHDGVRLASQWMSKHRQRPRFVLLHLMDPHWPYDAPRGFGEPRQKCRPCDDLVEVQYRMTDRASRAEIERRYRAEVAYTDYQIGKMIDALAADGTLDETLVVVTADHGEELWDHGRFLHGHQLYDELLHVPLIVLPTASNEGRIVNQQVLLEDVMPTVFDAIGVAPAGRADGVSLLGLISGSDSARGGDNVAVAGFVQAQDGPRFAIRTPEHKAIQGRDEDARELYELKKDPREKRNLASVRAEQTGKLLSLAERRGFDPDAIDTAGGSTDGTIDPALANELRELGYLSD